MGLDPLLTEAYVICGEARAAVGQDAEAPAAAAAGPSIWTSMRATPGSSSRARSLAPVTDSEPRGPIGRRPTVCQHAPVEAVRRLLDGAPVGQLVQLCRRLADDLEGPIDGPAAAVAAGAESMRRGA